MEVVERSPGRYFVRSESKVGWYRVKRWTEAGKERWACDCEGNIYRAEKDCKHIREARTIAKP
jgi:hypothetical protein